ncbi:hypothetical protein VB151_18790 [Xanthomonas fragariae]|uniref:hypothetical protein n=1 Tax=Xanthomonas fragariae TaxID=48664 RepID=UPI0012EA4BC7|nr:hypothetical protein [Xanthomonas fragariae]MBL9196863.1 hypothetical protein [Xanthomonas fragariae]MBL9221240.1 hypothetical protein [Xanthomonas fragariae]MEA5175556.1 hypothetical protein [Xanthomonas fragariae]MEA5212402.1 hypothetical protein [Xanthomonas fragariae]MEA5220849.1 hypothetical protein [Xanthomonas fragariae]
MHVLHGDGVVGALQRRYRFAYVRAIADQHVAYLERLTNVASIRQVGAQSFC